jgi:D-arabinose 1-dehydrogenase-like Zn-dependent alcohol dehydrogenase
VRGNHDLLVFETLSLRPGKRVGIIGFEGLGHFGVMWAKALGADKVVAISGEASKRADALDLGANSSIATDDYPSWDQQSIRSLDLVLSTIFLSKVRSPKIEPSSRSVRQSHPNDAHICQW